jgi:hypothetical protein
VENKKARPMWAALLNSGYESSVAIGVERMGHGGEEYILRHGNELERFGTKGRIDKKWGGVGSKADSSRGETALGMTRWVGSVKAQDSSTA